MKLLGGMYVFAGLAVLVGLLIGTLNGNGTNPVVLVVLLMGVALMFGLAASFLGPVSWLPRLVRVLRTGLGLMLLVLVVACLVAPGLIADPQATRAPTTEHGARIWGLVMVVPAVLLLGLPQLVSWLRRRP